jgi:hypothetical protein
MAGELVTKTTKRTETGSTPLPSPKSLSSLPPSGDTFIPAHGGYENLLSFQKARIVYDGTVRFCERFLKELLEDYRDFLRTGGLRLWDKNSREAQYVRRLGAKPNASYES